jgi:hypothetical protein
MARARIRPRPPQRLLHRYQGRDRRPEEPVRTASLAGALLSRVRGRITDPRLPKRSRNWATFTTDVVRTLGLTRRSASPHWYDAEGRLAAYVEVWSDTTDRSAYADTAEGSWLVLRHDLVAELARLRGADILFSVNWTRNRSSRYSQRSSDEQKQRGSHGYRLYLFNTESGWR